MLRKRGSFFSDSLLSYGVRILCCSNPHEKVSLTFECQNKWKSGNLSIYSESQWGAHVPPMLPARGHKPELLAPKEMPSVRDLQAHASIPVIMLHALAHIELGAIDNYWDTIVRFDPVKHQLSQEFYDDFLKVVGDEARHFAMVDRRLKDLGSEYGALPATRALLEHAANTAADLAARIAVVPLVQEARGLDSGDRLIHRMKSMGDPQSANVVEQIVREEQEHVRCGIKWFLHIANVQKRDKDPIAYFKELVLQFFPDGLPGPFDVKARLAANMGSEWYQDLETKSVFPPQSQTLRVKLSEDKDSQQRVATFASSKKKVILAGTVWPERTSSAAGVRSTDIINVLQERDFQVMCVSPSRMNEHSKCLQKQGVRCMQVDPNTRVFAKVLLEMVPQLVVFDRFIAEEMYGWQVKKYAPEALRVLDLQDLHFLRCTREIAVKKQGVRFEDTLNGSQLGIDPVEELAIRELASIHRSDLTLYVSEVERDLLVSRFQVPQIGLHRCDFFYPDIESSKLRSFDDRKDIAFIGSFKHKPNVDAVEWIRKTILPLFRNLENNAEIHIYGSHGETKRFANLGAPAQGLYMKGFAPNVHETLGRYRLSIAPLRFGAGIKGKIADSWFVGTPCVSTSIGAEGMVSDATIWGGAIANDPSLFVREMKCLYNDKSRWHTAQDAGVKLCSTLYNRSQNSDALMEGIERAMCKKHERRQQNWMGRILWSERFRATEYMSKYIRAKNEDR
ncbi:glycosyl transferase group 1 [Plasmopara halstedii]|uniref:Glycosyl transferase group 1 n=1 Tax=Plasmopara halstedii TaxID=4781 RepID=A0A0P1AGU2_PLAHL|nr:glycosyl transferase group 1 [Plasmopara halstedii]CEG40006.1 glycosyl transferase group 1 [Plasmopara halstedii]|eukprot:XP_024576375.1 glycosyl transferase group 1 [Plasmopara halstedii]